MQAIDEKFVELALRMADEAGGILHHYFRKDTPVETKADNSPVTAADREVEAALRALIEAHYPEHGISGEEFGNVREDSDYQWVIDPIDGTRAFIAGYLSFTTLISLAYQGVPILGVIDQPISCERWVGIIEQPTKQGGDAVTARECRSLGQAVIATTSTPYFSPAQAEMFHSLREQCQDVVLGGDAYAYAMLASGQMDIVVDAGMKTYDFCALRPVIEGAGGVITDWQGQPVTIKTDGCIIAAATPELHKVALEILRG